MAAVAGDYRCGWHTVHDHVITVADAALDTEPAPVRVLGIAIFHRPTRASPTKRCRTPW